MTCPFGRRERPPGLAALLFDQPDENICADTNEPTDRRGGGPLERSSLKGLWGAWTGEGDREGSPDSSPLSLKVEAQEIAGDSAHTRADVPKGHVRLRLDWRAYAMATYSIAVVKGDGIGPEVCSVAVEVIQHALDASTRLEWCEYPAGSGIRPRPPRTPPAASRSIP